MATPSEQTLSRAETKERDTATEYEVISPADDAIWQQYLVPFYQREKALFEQNFPTRDRQNPKYLAQLDHVALIGHSLKIPFYYGVPEKNCIVVAKKDTEIVGLAALVIDEQNEIPTSFIAVDWDNVHQGIGTELTRQSLAHLRNLGINEGQVSVWEGSAAIFHKLVATGELTEFIPDPQDKDGQVYRFKLSNSN